MNSFFDRAKTIASDLASRSKAAAQLTAKQATRTKIATVDLPRAFAALGKHLHATGTYRAEFANLHQQIDKLNSDVAAIEAQAANRPKVQGVGDKAKSVASAGKELVQVKALQHQATQAFTALGKIAYESHGETCGPEELVQRISDCESRIAALDTEILSLSSAPPGTIATPKRIAIVGLVLAVLFVFGLIGRLASGPDRETPTTASALPPTATGNDPAVASTTNSSNSIDMQSVVKALERDGVKAVEVANPFGELKGAAIQYQGPFTLAVKSSPDTIESLGTTKVIVLGNLRPIKYDDKDRRQSTQQPSLMDNELTVACWALKAVIDSNREKWILVDGRRVRYAFEGLMFCNGNLCVVSISEANGLPSEPYFVTLQGSRFALSSGRHGGTAPRAKAIMDFLAGTRTP